VFFYCSKRRTARVLRLEKGFIWPIKFQFARLRRQKFGSSSGRIDREIAQLELPLEDLEAARAEAEARSEAAASTESTAAKAATGQQERVKARNRAANGGTLEKARKRAALASTRTAQLYDRPVDRTTRSTR
jgi:hypothetical protein